ncbi:MAG: glycosyltransferase family 2 protein [Patescibacteria group bacterium]|nr:glycosyltransferase family 2 protein [Patescibacteria group bacterium]
MKLSIIIPVYNEKETILLLLEKVDRVDMGVIQKEIIIVDDGSNDGTRDLLKTVENKYNVIYQKINSGKGFAIRAGLAQATGDWVVIQDADLEYDPNDLKKMLEKIQKVNVSVVYGSRRLNRNYFNERHSGHIFALGGIFLTWLTNILFHADITDESTCYKMFKTDLIKSLKLACLKFEFCPEVTAKIIKKGIKIYEVQINYYPRQKLEGKKINWIDGLSAIWTLIKYKFVS